MHNELTARTAAGERLVALAEALAEQIAPHAAAHDRDGTFPFGSFAAVKGAGYFGAPIPRELGGLGVTSVHDVVVASSRLARGDASLTLGVDMHFAYVLNMVRRWRMATAAGDTRRADAFAAGLREVTDDGAVFAAAISERAQDLTRPATTATRTADGWIVSGQKIFCTMSPAADVLYASVTYTDRNGNERYGFAMISRDAPGVVIHGVWDALGMRASGSNSVTFDDVLLPASAVRGGYPVGDAVEAMDRMLNAGLLHAATALGVAESAVRFVLGPLRRRAELDARTQMLAAENVVELAACRAILARAAGHVDDLHERHPTAPPPTEEVTSAFAEAQSAKAFVGETAVRIVDRTLALSGGAGYLNGSPLARAYRDVRATSFMHPLGANRAYAFLADVAAGRVPTLH